MPQIQRMSEARLNDLVYLTLKKLFFEAWGMAPRGCDIRVCMNLIESATFKGSNPFATAILLPHEKAPASHTTFYDVDTDATLEH